MTSVRNIFRVAMVRQLVLTGCIVTVFALPATQAVVLTFTSTTLGASPWSGGSNWDVAPVSASTTTIVRGILRLGKAGPTGGNFHGGLIASERAQHGDGFGELGGGIGGFEAREAPAFQQDVVAVTVEHQPLAGNLDRRDVFMGGQRFDPGDLQ